MKKLLTQSEYAIMRGCSQQYISKLIQKGRIVLINGKIDPDQADQQIEDTADPLHNKNLKSEETKHYNQIYTQARTKRMFLEGQLAKLQYEIIKGLRIPVEDVEKAFFESGRMTRDAYMALPYRYEYKIQHAKDEVHLDAILKELEQDILDIIEASRERLTNFVNSYPKRRSRDDD